jgi:hypothetical protein
MNPILPWVCVVLSAYCFLLITMHLGPKIDELRVSYETDCEVEP